jgi:PAS domain S-box-containing protein
VVGDDSGVQGNSPSLTARVTISRGPITLRSYLNFVVAIFMTITVLGVLYQRRTAATEAGAAARGEARWAAERAASDIDRDLATMEASVAELAVTLRTGQLFDGGVGCILQFPAAGTFRTGHIDVIATDGEVACSSMAAAPVSYHDAAWLGVAVSGPAVVGPQIDARSARYAVVVSAPVPGYGVVAAFLDVDAVGPALSGTIGGRGELEFLLTTADRRRAITRSVEPQRWSGTDLAATPFAEVGARLPRRDVDGVPRYYGSAPVEATSWLVFAGAERSSILAAIDDGARRDLLVAVCALIVMIPVALTVSRKIARPLALLDEEVRRAGANSRRPPVRVSGPKEVAELAAAFNRLTANLHSELDSTARLAEIVESSHDSIISWTLSGTIRTWNSGAERMYGYPARDAIGADLSLIVPAEDTAQVVGIHEEVERVGHASSFEARRVRRDGSIADVAITVSPIRDRTGAIVALSAVGRDITAAKRALEALHASEGHKSAVLASALDAMITTTGTGRVAECNPAAERTFGYARADILERDLVEVLLPRAEWGLGALDRFLPTAEDHLRGRRTELTSVRADGTPFPAEVSVTLVDAPGQPVYSWFIRDRSPEKAVEDERRALEDRLHQSERLQSLGRLAGGVAHDFNNLLAVIMNYATFVADTVPGQSAVRSDIDQILAASERGVALTRQLLTFARREPALLELLDVNEVVEGFFSLLSRSVGAKVELVFDAVGELPMIQADRGQVEQVLINLALNARDASSNGSVVTFETSTVILGPEDAAARPGRYVRLVVIDCGIGMSAEVCARIFEPFFTTKGRTEGTGLGLATVYGIMTDLGGHVTVSSEEGRGTRFNVYFPVAQGLLGTTPTIADGVASNVRVAS